MKNIIVILIILFIHKSKCNSMPAMPIYGSMVKKMQLQSMGAPDPEVGNMVDKMKDGDNADEMGTYFESDMLTPMTFSDDPSSKKFQFRWSDGIVPYRFDGTFSGQDRALIMAGMEQFPKYTCIRFVPHTGQQDYISIENKHTGCWSSLGRIGGKQVVNLQTPGCTSQIGTSMHEFMHALGIFHEQSRDDRDSYVRIRWENIQSGKGHNFDVHKKYYGFGVPYDYGSVMHYSLKAFSRNNDLTIDPIQRSNTASIGQRKMFSKSDIAKINSLYGCRNININQIPDRIEPVFKPFTPFSFFQSKYPTDRFSQNSISTSGSKATRKKFWGLF